MERSRRRIWSSYEVNEVWKMEGGLLFFRGSRGEVKIYEEDVEG